MSMEKAVINNNAVGTWLEPYIGYEVNVTRKNKDTVWFSFHELEPEEYHDIELFSFNQNKSE